MEDLGSQVQALAIVGLGPGHELGLSLNCTRWGMGTDPYLAAYDLGFEMHTPDLWPEGRVDHLNEANIPILMHEAVKEVPLSMPYPHEGRDYYVCTISYMLSLAVRVAKEILLVGVTGGGEYAWQRPNLEYWLGVAEGKGIQVEAPGFFSLDQDPAGPFYGERYGWR